MPFPVRVRDQRSVRSHARGARVVGRSESKRELAIRHASVYQGYAFFGLHESDLTFCINRCANDLSETNNRYVADDAARGDRHSFHRFRRG